MFKKIFTVVISTLILFTNSNFAYDVLATERFDQTVQTMQKKFKTLSKLYAIVKEVFPEDFSDSCKCILEHSSSNDAKFDDLSKYAYMCSVEMYYKVLGCDDIQEAFALLDVSEEKPVVKTFIIDRKEYQIVQNLQLNTMFRNLIKILYSSLEQ